MKTGPLTRRFFLMGTICEIQIWNASNSAGVAATTAAFQEIDRIEKVLSVFLEDSELSRINRSGGRWIAASEELFGLIDAALEYSRKLNGAFDITAGSFLRSRRHPGDGPSVSDEPSLRSVGWRKVFLDREARAVAVAENATLDFGALGKGYALDRGAGVLRRLGAQSALINFGGQVLVMGLPPEDTGWDLFIASPERRSEPLLRLSLKEGSVATTSQSERAGHVMDPGSGKAAGFDGSVTVVAPSAAEADALSTGLFVLGAQAGLRWVERFAPHVAACFVEKREMSWTIKASQNFGQYVSGFMEPVAVR